MRPVVSDLTELVYESVEPLTRKDEELDYPFLKFLDAWVSSFLGSVYDIVKDRDDRPGWAILFDPDLCPEEALPFLAQFVGAVLTQSLTEEDRRTEVKTPAGWDRGTPDALIEAVKRTLTGLKRVIVEERYLGNAYHLWIRTLTDETPDEAETEAAILTQKPMGIVLLYEVVESISWFDVDADNEDWAEVKANYATWQDLLTTEPAP